MKKQIDYCIIQTRGIFKYTNLIKEVIEAQEKGWKCIGGFVLDEEFCLQAMIKEEE